LDQIGLGLIRPNCAAGAAAVTKTGPVKSNHAVTRGCHCDQAARHEILDHAAIPVQQNKWFTFSALDDM